MRRTWQIQAEQHLVPAHLFGLQRHAAVAPDWTHTAHLDNSWVTAVSNEEPYFEMWAKGERCKRCSTVLRKTDLDVTGNKEVTVWSSSKVSGELKFGHVRRGYYLSVDELTTAVHYLFVALVSLSTW